MSARNLWRGLAGKMSQHFSVCTSAVLHLGCKGTKSHKEPTLRRGSFLIPWSCSINLCIERYRASKEAVEGASCGSAEEDVSLFCPCRVEPYWPAVAWTEKCPAVLFPLHRLARSLIRWWHWHCLDLSLSTPSTRTGRKGVAVTSNVTNVLTRFPWLELTVWQLSPEVSSVLPRRVPGNEFLDLHTAK